MGFFSKRKSVVAAASAPEPFTRPTAIDTGYYGSNPPTPDAKRLREAIHDKNELPAIPGPAQTVLHKLAPGRRAPPPSSPNVPSPGTPVHHSSKSLSSDFLYVTSESSYTSSEGDKHPNSHYYNYNQNARAPQQHQQQQHHVTGNASRWSNSANGPSIGNPSKLPVHQQPPATPQQHHVNYPATYPPPPPSDTSLEYTSTVSAGSTKNQAAPGFAPYPAQYQNQIHTQIQNQQFQHQWQVPQQRLRFLPQKMPTPPPQQESENLSSAGSMEYESSDSGQTSDVNKQHPYYQQWKEYYTTLAAMNNGQQQRKVTPSNNRHSLYGGEISQPQQQEMAEANAPQQKQSYLDIQKRKRHSIASLASASSSRNSSSRVPLSVMKSSAITKDTSVHSFNFKQHVPHSNSQYSFAPSPKPKNQDETKRDYLSSYSATHGEEMNNDLVLNSRKSVLRSNRYPSEPISVHLNHGVPVKQNRISSFSGSYVSKGTSPSPVKELTPTSDYSEGDRDGFDFQSDNNNVRATEEFSDLEYGSDDENHTVPHNHSNKYNEELIVEGDEDDVTGVETDNSFENQAETTFSVNTNPQPRIRSRKSASPEQDQDEELADFAEKLEELEMDTVRKPSKQISDYSKFLFDDSESEADNSRLEPMSVEQQLLTPETYKGETFDAQSATTSTDEASIQSNGSGKFTTRKVSDLSRQEIVSGKPEKVNHEMTTGNISLSELSPPRSPQRESASSSGLNSAAESTRGSEPTLDPRKYRSQLMYSIPANAHGSLGEFPLVPQPPMMTPNMFGSPTPSLFSDSTSTSVGQQNQMQMQMMMQMMQMMNPMFNPMQMMNPMMYEMMKKQNGANGFNGMTPEMLQYMYNGNGMQPNNQQSNRHLMYPQMNALVPNLAPEHRFSMIGLNGANGNSSPGTSPVRRRALSKDQEISEKIEEFINLRQVIASGNKTLEYRLKWIKMLITATNYKLYQFITIKGQPIRPSDVAQTKQLFIKSSLSHLLKLVRDDKLNDDSIRSECYVLYASLFKHDFVELYEEDFGIEKDIPQAIAWYSKSLELYPNDYKCLYKLGEIYEFDPPTLDVEDTEGGTVPDPFTMALDYYKQSAKFGYNRAIYKISLLYLNVPEIRSTKFFRYFHDLANIKIEQIRLDGEDKQELVEIIGLSCFQLGRIYEGIYPGDLTLEDTFIKECLEIAPVNYAKALSYYNRSAKAGCLHAQVKLGYIYEYGELDRQKNASKSVQWYMKATSSALKFRRSPKAMLGLARWCLVGTEGISRHIPKEDPGKAVSWCERAIEQFDDAEAYFMKGELCEQGICHDDANKWYQEAYQRGHQMAANKL